MHMCLKAWHHDDIIKWFIIDFSIFFRPIPFAHVFEEQFWSLGNLQSISNLQPLKTHTQSIFQMMTSLWHHHMIYYTFLNRVFGSTALWEVTRPMHTRTHIAFMQNGHLKVNVSYYLHSDLSGSFPPHSWKKNVSEYIYPLVNAQN